jgi:hemerythrin-like metal-binding protein
MDLIVWGGQYLVGVAEIDEQHAAFANIINKLIRGQEEGISADLAYRLAYELHAYAEYHFVCEETLMIVRDWPARQDHHHEHQRIAHILKVKTANLAKGQDTLASLAQFARSWLLSHTLREDRRFGLFVQTGRNEPPSPGTGSIARGEAAPPAEGKTTSRIFRVDQQEATARIRRLGQKPPS